MDAIRAALEKDLAGLTALRDGLDGMAPALSEASHGDLGMVQPDDVILALSWSGETRELSDVIGYAKRRGVPLIAMTRAAESTLARAATVAIVLPDVREACPHNLAPTTSTLVQMAMGDAIAIALLDRRGFSEESFHGFHPGGSLGRQLLRVREVMSCRKRAAGSWA